MNLEITNAIDDDGTPIVYVPLKNSDRSAVLYRQDFDALMAMRIDPRWRISNNQVYEIGRDRIPISRLIANAQKGEKICIKDGDICNLKRDNLVPTRGGGRSNTVDKVASLERTTFRRNVILKPIDKPVPWLAELMK
jgi:hypothetical protein